MSGCALCEGGADMDAAIHANVKLELANVGMQAMTQPLVKMGVHLNLVRWHRK